MYITKVKNKKKRLNDTHHMDSEYFPNFLVLLWIHLIDEGRLFHRILFLKCIELRPKRNYLTGGRNTLIPFLKSYGIGFSLK